MRDLLKLLPIYSISLLAQFIFNYFNFTFLFSKLKTGVYTVPFIGHVFQSWWSFTIAAWLFNCIAYIPATVLVAWGYRISVENFGVIYLAMIIGQIASILTSILFIYLTTGEVPDRNSWIALTLVLVASVFVVYSKKST